MHTDETLQVMDNVTQFLGDAVCAFEIKMCPVFHTTELKCEAEGRQCREARACSQHEHTDSTAVPLAHRPETLNLHTYKFHALGDYMASIQMYRTTDSYSTQPVSSLFGYIVLVLLITMPSGRAGTQSQERTIHTNQLKGFRLSTHSN